MHYWSEKGLQGTDLNLTFPFLHGGSLEITLTVALKGSDEQGKLLEVRVQRYRIEY